ncbi:hypothetical protein [Enterococcus ureasiticus]|uniref:Glycosyltransferase RgtA/B/C/D-like domain-containing protein n=1 Tax=Enterococcus ureasiticus TaxID=903984 RepID=A0A1E5GFB0_9ENTE|nr:hypothetical protein [Enterococcus ureasiticus]OEG11408.1 hypothetical protein BCR21_08910 [Enterococcus ureasiticus]
MLARIKGIFADKRKTNFILLTILVVLTLVRVIIQLKIPPVTLAGKGVDEHVFVVQATEFIKGNWFGDYDFITIVKNPMFSFFYVLLNKFSIPYPLGLMLLYIISCLALVYALSPIVKNKYGQSLIYLYLLYSPVMLDKHFGFRLYRDALLMPLILLVLASLIGLFLYRNHSKKILIFWALLAGISYSSFTYLREDSVWLKPFFFTALLITFIFLLFIKSSWKEKIYRMLFLVIPILVLQGCTYAISYQNLQKYGIFTVNDYTQTNFKNVVSDLISIDDGRNQEYVWVSEDTFREALSVSPTLNKISKEVDWLYDPENGMTVEMEDSGNHEIFGGNIVWDLRLVVARAEQGYRQEMIIDGKSEKGGKATDEYFEKVHEELSEAFDQGQLTRRSDGVSVSPSSPAKTWSDIRGNVFPKMKRTLRENVFYSRYGIGLDGINPGHSLTTVSGDPEAVREIEMLINFPLNYPIGTPEAEYNKPVTYMAKRINSIISIYKWTSPIVILIAMIGFLYSGVRLIKKDYSEKNITVFLVGLGLILSYAVLLFGIAWAYSWVSGDTMSRLYYYSSGAIPVLQVLSILGSISFVSLLMKIQANHSKHNRKH